MESTQQVQMFAILETEHVLLPIHAVVLQIIRAFNVKSPLVIIFWLILHWYAIQMVLVLEIILAFAIMPIQDNFVMFLFVMVEMLMIL